MPSHKNEIVEKPKSKTPKKKATNKKSSQTRKLMKVNCNPKIVPISLRKGKTCFRKEDIHLLRTEFNKTFPKYSIDTEIDDVNDIMDALRLRMNQHTKCRREDCWLQIITDDTLRNRLIKELYRPIQPPDWNENPNKWLTNHDIEKVLQQYEKKYSNFRLIGPTTIDFDKQHSYYGGCVEEVLCKFNYHNYLSENPGIDKLGIIINYDVHTGNGTHWVALFIDLKEKFLMFFDSQADYSKTVKPEIQKFINRVKQQEPSFNVIINKKTHQNTSTECGMYVLHFLITMLIPTEHCRRKLKDKESVYDSRINYFTKTRVPDKDMIYLRNVYFNKNIDI
uniref:Ubiquitin-like protease family profile domain-containing protein n=1 Tax=viral metagenome TaxID=1070528 RepID=A0A6C0ATK1_9ZZZZ|tara:strand:- start:20150 stop:21157 length:1008 start_codon:yes stop_codon:yes gene_type:complete